MTDYARVRIILALILFLILYLTLDSGGRSYISIPLILIASSLIAFLFYNLSPSFKNSIPPFKNSLLFPLIILATILVFSTIFSISPSTSLPQLIYLSGLFLLFVLTCQISLSKKQIKFIFYFIFGLTLLEAAVAICFFLISELEGSFIRMFGTFYWPNPLAGFLLLTLPISLFLFWSSSGRVRFWLLFPCSIILSVFVLTYSKGAFLSFILPFSLLVYHFRHVLKKEFLLKLISLIFLTILLTFGILSLRETTYHLFKQAVRPKESGQVTSFTRLSYMKGAWKIFLDNKFIGTGPATFNKVYPQYQKHPTEFSEYPHNFYLELLSETGIFGLLSFLVFVSGLIFLGIKLLKRQDKISLPLFAATLGSLSHIVVDIDFSFPAIFLLFWFFSALLYGIYLKSILRKQQVNYLSLVLLIFSAFFFIFGLSFFLSNNNLAKAEKLEESGNLGEAKIYYQKSLNFLNKNPQVYYYLSRIEYANGNLKEAEKLTQDAVIKDSYSALNYQLLGRIYFKMGDKGKAEQNFKKAISKDSLNNPEFYIDLANLYLNLNQKEKAKETVLSILPYYTENTINTLHLRPELPFAVNTLKKILEEAQK